MPTTFVHGLLPPACLLVSKSALPRLSPREWLRFGLASAIIANSPDLDLILSLMSPSHWMDFHRPVGHNIFALTALAIMGRWLLAWAAPKLSRTQGTWISIGLIASHAIFDAMGTAAPHEIHHGTPLLWPVSSWELVLPSVFPRYDLVQDPHFLMAHIKSVDYWKYGLLKEFLSSVYVLVAWAAIFHVSLGLRRLFSGKDSSESSSLSQQSSQQYNQVLPLRRRQDGIPTRRDRDSSRAS